MNPNYIKETFLRNRACLLNADWSDIVRMAYIGDRLISAALSVNFASLDKDVGEFDKIWQAALSNENFSKNFKDKYEDRTSDWSRGTVIEACFYLDYFNFGMDFLIKKSLEIPFKLKNKAGPKKELMVVSYNPVVGVGKALTFNQNAVFCSGQTVFSC